MQSNNNIDLYMIVPIPKWRYVSDDSNEVIFDGYNNVLYHFERSPEFLIVTDDDPDIVIGPTLGESPSKSFINKNRAIAIYKETLIKDAKTNNLSLGCIRMSLKNCFSTSKPLNF